MNLSKTFRVEHDLLGDRELSNDVYFGVHTLRARENFDITQQNISTYPDLIRALAWIKKAAAISNAELGMIHPDHAKAIGAACDEIIAGKWHEHFVVDVIQGGAGTSTNMNANEVIANRGLEIMGYQKGEFQHLHPNEHVNCAQSTNDVYPTALKLAMWHGVERLLKNVSYLHDAFAGKADEFKDMLKMGRTQMQDAVPMTLGQEFNTYAGMMRDGEKRLRGVQQHLCIISMGATAIGSGIASHPDYAALVLKHLRQITGMDLQTAKDLFQATQDCGAFTHLSGILKSIAINLSKICNDLRLLSSGPRAGLNEINLPAVQAGSSIMAGKVNPVIPELVNQVAFEIIGNDAAVNFAAEAGQLQLNAFEPLIAHSLFKSILHLSAACRTLADRCVKGITANADLMHQRVLNSIGIVTALNPYIGYANATAIAQQAHASGGSVYDIVLERKLLTREQLDAIFKPEVLTQAAPLDIAPKHSAESL